MGRVGSPILHAGFVVSIGPMLMTTVISGVVQLVRGDRGAHEPRRKTPRDIDVTC